VTQRHHCRPFHAATGSNRFAKSIMADYLAGQTLALKFDPLNERPPVLILDNDTNKTQGYRT
jgi:hypothetical protein